MARSECNQLLHLTVKSVTPFVPKAAPLLPANEQGVIGYWMFKALSGFTIGIFVVVLLIIAFYVGAFASSFNTHLCYTDVLSTITKKVESANTNKSTEEYEQLESLLKRLPLRGYESDCQEIKRETGNL